MILLTPELRERLLINGRSSALDHVRVPLGIGAWLAMPTATRCSGYLEL
jgi:hypothetical protein